MRHDGDAGELVQPVGGAARSAPLLEVSGLTKSFGPLTAVESARMERLVGDLLDSTGIESGVLRLQRDWCDLALVASAAANCLSGAPPTWRGPGWGCPSHGGSSKRTAALSW